ncbi:MAG: hypothetical protein ACKVWR_03295 [Acidimicrobiales bacterium]
MHLTVVVDGHDAHDRTRLLVADQEHRPDDDLRGLRGVGQSRLTEAIVIHGVEVGDQIECSFQ